jgi:hypothetical protein
MVEHGSEPDPRGLGVWLLARLLLAVLALIGVPIGAVLLVVALS